MTFLNTNGLVLHYEYLQSQSSNRNYRKTFLFINSLGTDLRIWNDVVGIVKEHGDIILFDNRGHGLSDTSSSRSVLNDFADDTEALLDHLKIEKCIVIGLSVGGMIAQILASRRPSTLEKLILCDTRHKIGNEEIWNERIRSVRGHGFSSISGGVMQRWFSESFRKNNPAIVSGFKNMLERTSKTGYIQTCEAIRDADLTAITKHLKVPTLCIVGSEDKSTPPDEVKQLSELIEDSRFEVIQDSGHIPCVDNPKVLSNLILDFIKN